MHSSRRRVGKAGALRRRVSIGIGCRRYITLCCFQLAGRFNQHSLTHSANFFKSTYVQMYLYVVLIAYLPTRIPPTPPTNTTHTPTMLVGPITDGETVGWPECAPASRTRRPGTGQVQYAVCGFSLHPDVVRTAATFFLSSS